MKYSVMILFAISLALASCKNNDTQSNDTTNHSEQQATMYACPMHPEITGKKGSNCTTCGMALAVPVKTGATTSPGDELGKASIKEIMSDYLLVKNALTADNTADAAAAAKALEATLRAFNKTAFTSEQKQVFEAVEEDAIEHAEHIGVNGGKIDHQREHFALLSKDIYDLVKAFGNDKQPLYQDFCPMYDNGKGAIWLSETKEIANPYYGKKMFTCGKINEEIN